MGFEVQQIWWGKTGKAHTERNSEQSVPLSLGRGRAEWGVRRSGWEQKAGLWEGEGLKG